MTEPVVRADSDIAFQIFLEGGRELLGVEQWSRFADGYEAYRANAENQAGVLLRGLEEVYGPAAGQGLALRIGRAIFRHGLKQLGDQAGFRAMDFRMLPSSRRVESGLYTLARMVTEYTDSRVVVSDEGPYWSWRIESCPFCQGHHASQACCYLMVGLIQEFAGWADGGHFYRVVEVACQAASGEACIFHIDKKPLDCG
jgi:predicted hydrocarbon binding protein